MMIVYILVQTVVWGGGSVGREMYNVSMIRRDLAALPRQLSLPAAQEKLTEMNPCK